MEEHQMIKKIPIGALQPGYGTVMIVALVISKSDPRRIVSKGRDHLIQSLKTSSYFQPLCIIFQCTRLLRDKLTELFL